LPVNWRLYFLLSAGQIVGDVEILYRLLPAGKIAGKSRSYILGKSRTFIFSFPRTKSPGKSDLIFFLLRTISPGKSRSLILSSPRVKSPGKWGSYLLFPAGEIVKEGEFIELLLSRGSNPRMFGCPVLTSHGSNPTTS
jgi:hypothetical protein